MEQQEIYNIQPAEYRCDEDLTDLDKYVGRYVNVSLFLTLGSSSDDNRLVVFKVDNTLFIQSSQLPRTELRPISKDLFMLNDHDSQIHFITNTSGVVAKLIMLCGNNGFVADKL